MGPQDCIYWLWSILNTNYHRNMLAILALQYTLSSLDKGHCSILLACYFTLITGYVRLLVVTIYGCTLLTTSTHSCPNIVIYGSKKTKQTNKKNALRF